MGELSLQKMLDMHKSEAPVCQSCSLIMESPEQYGTEADGSLNYDFCRRCYAEGCFTEPRLTRWQIISRIVPLWMKENNLTYREALVDVNHFISGLRRWQAKGM